MIKKLLINGFKKDQKIMIENNINKLLTAIKQQLSKFNKFRIDP